MRRIRLIVEYDGGHYAGWQRQINAVSVQQRLEEALRTLTKENELSVTGASRTDAGVHALGQNVHFDTASRIPADKFCYALNTLLPCDIRVIRSMEADDAFHARYSAKGKEYRYVFYNSPHASALYRGLSAHIMYPLNEALMDKEAKLLLGTHDFGAFAASGSQIKDTVRTIDRADVVRHGDFVVFTVHGSGFLYNMVRIIAGTLAGVGTGKIEPGAVKRALKSLSRLDLGVTAPPQGLTLMHIDY